ncbi:hypothetical protein GGR53DRAFT_137223 [Hypoxylon sp. FL1150]|nr:hypothetical protein GGR53DRAFT_137223 [Hypoxylon sp. FL1150]
MMLSYDAILPAICYLLYLFLFLRHSPHPFPLSHLVSFCRSIGTRMRLRHRTFFYAFVASSWLPSFIAELTA